MQLSYATVGALRQSNNRRETKMLATFSRKMLVVRTVLLCTLTGAGWMLQGAGFDRARDLASRVQGDLQKAADFTRTNEKERVRYENVQHLSEFDWNCAMTISIKASSIRPSMT
jgi:hypothetical protein